MFYMPVVDQLSLLSSFATRIDEISDCIAILKMQLLIYDVINIQLKLLASHYCPRLQRGYTRLAIALLY